MGIFAHKPRNTPPSQGDTMIHRNVTLPFLLLAAIASLAATEDTPLAAPALKDVTFHVLPVPHTILHEDFSACAFTMKALRLCSMLKSLGLKSILYGNEGSDHDCDRMETILSNEERQQYFGPDERWKSGGMFYFEDKQGRELFDQRVTEAVEKNKGNGTVDILLATFGYGNKAIVDATGLVAIETGIGYGGTFARFRVYESYAWLHVLNGDTHVNHYHTVIPNCYYPSEFEGAQPSVQGRYLVFVGRLIEEKGIEIALQILEHMPQDYTLHLAGQGDLNNIHPRNILFSTVLFITACSSPRNAMT